MHEGLGGPQLLHLEGGKLISDATVHAGALDDVPFDRLRALLGTHTFARVTGLFSRDDVLAARDKLQARFDVKNDRKHDPKDAEAIRRNFQKLIVGGTRGTNACPRFLRMFYNPTFDEDIFGMHVALTEAVRNALQHGHRPDLPPRVEVRYRVNEERSCGSGRSRTRL